MDRGRNGPLTRFAGVLAVVWRCVDGCVVDGGEPSSGGVVGDTIYRAVSVGVGNGGEGYDGAGGEISLIRGERK
jgi:hypothetical protein